MRTGVPHSFRCVPRNSYEVAGLLSLMCFSEVSLAFETGPMWGVPPVAQIVWAILSFSRHPLALYAFAALLRVQACKVLLDAGAPLDTKASSGGTALMFASAAGYMDVVKLLLEKGADVNARVEVIITHASRCWRNCCLVASNVAIGRLVGITRWAVNRAVI